MLASVRLVWLATRVGLLRRHLGQIYADSRQTLSFRYRLPKALRGIVQKASQHGTTFDFFQTPYHRSGGNEVFELDEKDTESIFCFFVFRAITPPHKRVLSCAQKSF